MPQALPATADACVTPARWQSLQRFTDARIALGRAGHSLPTAAHLAFQLDHAQARDAVHLAFNAQDIASALQALSLETFILHSAAPDRATYLQRPDLGRRLDELSRHKLLHWQSQRSPSAARFDLAFVVADGLSALAVHRNAVDLVAATLKLLRADPVHAWTVAPVAIVEQGRVAIGDDAGNALQANVVAVLIGERPGLSSPDSLGVYLTWAPKIGLTDANRNCISNVRSAGLAVQTAAQKLHQLLTHSRQRQLTGVELKDDSDTMMPVVSTSSGTNFLLASDHVQHVPQPRKPS
jgi:ethanolamine ammonia-lyase small subunit